MSRFSVDGQVPSAVERALARVQQTDIVGVVLPEGTVLVIKRPDTWRAAVATLAEWRYITGPAEPAFGDLSHPYDTAWTGATFTSWLIPCDDAHLLGDVLRTRLGQVLPLDRLAAVSRAADG